MLHRPMTCTSGLAATPFKSLQPLPPVPILAMPKRLLAPVDARIAARRQTNRCTGEGGDLTNERRLSEVDMAEFRFEVAVYAEADHRCEHLLDSVSGC